MNSPHLAIVVRGADPPSAVSSVALHHARVLSQGFRVTVLSDTFPAGVHRDCKRSDFTRVEFSVPQFNFLRRLCHVPNELAFLWEAYRQLQRLHSERPINFIWCHSHPVAACSLYHFRRRFGIPFGLTVHGDIFDRPRGTYDPILTRFYRMATPLAYRRASVIQVLAPVWKKSVLRWGVDDDKVVVIPNGVSLCEFLPVRHTMRSARDPLQILFVGRLRLEKGVDTLLRAASILKDRRVSFEMLVIGDAPRLQALKTMALKSGLDSHVRFIGRIPRERLGQYYSDADVVCVPSLSESLATVVLESLAHGTPVVASNIGGNSYMIEEGRNGWLIEPNDPGALARRLEQLADNRQMCTSKADNARQSIQDNFSWDQIGNKLAEAINCHLESLPDID